MKRLITVIILTFISLSTFSQQTSENLVGTYYSVNNKFEKCSILLLFDNNRYEYQYVLGGCQANVTGEWKIENKLLRLVSDNEFDPNDTTGEKVMINDTVTLTFYKTSYPNFSNFGWKIGKNWLKPLGNIDTGCFIENGKHKKKRAITKAITNDGF